jgi:hypothetical protein
VHLHSSKIQSPGAEDLMADLDRALSFIEEQ